MQVTVDSRRVSLLARARPWVAVIVAAIILALVPLVGLQLIFVVPLVGLALAVGPKPWAPVSGTSPQLTRLRLFGRCAPLPWSSQMSC